MIEKIEEAIRVAAREIILRSEANAPVAFYGGFVCDCSCARTVTVHAVSACAQDDCVIKDVFADSVRSRIAKQSRGFFRRGHHLLPDMKIHRRKSRKCAGPASRPESNNSQPSSIWLFANVCARDAGEPEFGCLSRCGFECGPVAEQDIDACPEFLVSCQQNSTARP